LVLGALFAVFWLNNRAAPWFGWWSATLLLGGVTSALYMWRGTDSVTSLGLGNTALVASFACCWQGARGFDRRRPLWAPVLVAPFPFGALPMDYGWVGAFNLLMFAHTILLSVLLVSLSKERLEFAQRTKAQTDPLTGALNRRALMWRGERLLHRHAYERTPLC